jgi:hypothetical protein
MKRIILVFALVAAVLSAFGYFLYSAENVEPTEDELAKYPALSPFLVGRTGFRGIRFNLDNNYYSFAFTTSFSKTESYFAEVDSAASREQWRLVTTEPYTRVYVRKAEVPIGALQWEKVTLTYDSERQEVTLVREDADSDRSPGSE